MMVLIQKLIKPTSNSYIELNDKNGNPYKITKKNKVVTFVNRNLEPYRGYHKFMDALPDIVNNQS